MEIKYPKKGGAKKVATMLRNIIEQAHKNGGKVAEKMNLKDSNNSDYHADLTHLSSSALKLLLKSPEAFYEQYVLGQKPEQQFEHFDEGSFVHTLILEPHKVVEYAIYPGLRKAGKAYLEFKEANKGKIVLSSAQEHRCRKLEQAYKNMAVAVDMLKTGNPEHTMTSSMLGVPIKARADFIDQFRGIIVDVKTTSLPSGADIFSQTVLQYNYDLSAALYAQIAHDTYGKLFDFYWLVLSKHDLQCHIYKASSATLSQGAARCLQAIVLYKRCKETGDWVAEHPKPQFDTADYEIEDI